MATGRAYLTSFGTTPTMTLHNGTTHFIQRPIPRTRRAVISYVTLPTQVIYDLDGTDQAPVVPEEELTAIVLVKLATAALIEAEWAAWEAHIGKVATLTATRIGGAGTLTCTARLVSIDDVTQFPENISRPVMTVLATFAPKTNLV